MQRYVRWRREGFMSSTGECFDIGVTTGGALPRFMQHGDPYAGSDDLSSAGNESLMRLSDAARPGAAVLRERRLGGGRDGWLTAPV